MSDEEGYYLWRIRNSIKFQILAWVKDTEDESDGVHELVLEQLEIAKIEVSKPVLDELKAERFLSISFLSMNSTFWNSRMRGLKLKGP